MQCDEHRPANKIHEAKKMIPLNLHICIIQLYFQHFLQLNCPCYKNVLLATPLSNKKPQIALRFKAIKEIKVSAI